MAAGRRLRGKVAIVTGGTHGIGAATARLFQAEGARVVLVARGGEAGRGMEAALGRDVARFVAGDVADERTAQDAVAAAVEGFGALDILVNNAALDFVKPISDTTLAEARRVLDVNLLGAFLMLREAGAAMQERAGGSIVNVVSRYALIGGSQMGLYSAAKGALLSLTRSAAVEWAPRIRVNAVAPGPTETPLIEAWIRDQPDPDRFRAGLEARLPLGRLGEPEDVAWSIVYLASDEARQVTGACLTVDGGFTAG